MSSRFSTTTTARRTHASSRGANGSSSIGTDGSSSSSLFRRSSPTFWIGVSMFCLVILYVAVVILVARRHMQQVVAQETNAATLGQEFKQQQPYREAVARGVDYQLKQPQQLSESVQQRIDQAKARLQQKQEQKQQQEQQDALEEASADKDDDDGEEEAAADADSADDDKKEVDAAAGPNDPGQASPDNDDDKDKADDKQQSAAKDGEEEEGSNDDDAETDTEKKRDEDEEDPKVMVRPYYEKLKARGDFGHGVEPQVLVLQPPDTSDLQLTASRIDGPVDRHPTPQYILKAFVEKVDFAEWEQKPLPLRATAAKDQLEEITYSRLNSCRNMIAQFPVDDTPTDKDPFLPWIHDVFPTADGKFIQFVAQNKRRCRTGSSPSEQETLAFMQPQASIFQHVPVKRVTVNDGDGSTTNSRYKLVPYEEADADGLVTRFICRFKPSMEETLSVYNNDYDWTAYRKRYRMTFGKDDGGLKSIHTTQLMFKCPVPDHLQETVRTGAAVENDWTSLFVDLIPIRTPPRYGAPNRYLAPWYSEFQAPQDEDAFQPKEEWGDSHILPRIEDSGRWENIPICKPSLMAWEGATVSDLPATKDDPIPKRHKLVSCIWASAGYATRGNRFAINDGQRRLLEWMIHNKNIGFDHTYIFDNTGAFRNDTSLKPIADLFPGEATLIPWPSTICNNNPNNVDSPGERSSQYAAESSCRLRFGAHVDWIGQFDIDEYLVPMGDHKTVTSLLAKLDKEDTRIISFPSWRAWPRWQHIGPIDKIDDRKVCWSQEPCFHLTIPLTTTMLQAYNCDRQLPGQKSQSMPAEKQIYKADYVTQHFVHYSAATELSALNRSEYEKHFTWRSRAFPDRRQRFANEVTEGLMIHTKAVATQDTVGWERVCHIDIMKEPNKWHRGLCRLGVPWPVDPGLITNNATEEGWAYNCYVNRKVEEYFVPQLNAGIKKYKFFDQ